MAEEYHKQIRTPILQAYESLTKLGREKSYFSSYDQTASMMDNNTAARVASQIHTADGTLVQMCEERLGLADSVSAHELMKADDLEEKGAVNIVWRHGGDTSMLTNLQSGRYIIPPRCTFLMSDIEYLHKAYTDLGRFDLVVMDPPWENKSVKRKKKYGSLQNDMVLDLPLQGLMNPGCIVAVWVTNRMKHLQFVMEQLLPRHKVQFSAKLFWLKVTRAGETVYDLDSAHKKPYETLIIGEYGGKTGYRSKLGEVLDNKVILSVPCSLHSKKPPLTEVLTEYLPTNPRCLELFARNLWPHWTSWGNEVLLHQHTEFYERVT